MKQDWEIKRLEEIAADIPYPIGDGDHGQIKPKDYTSKGIPYIRVGDMGWGEFNPKNMVYIPEAVHQQNLKSKLIPGDILIAKTGATIGKCCIIPDTILEANTTSSVGKITVDQTKVLPRWVLLYFLTPSFLKFIWSISNRAAQPGFNNRDIKLFEIPVPPLLEQQRIVAILDEAFAAIAKAKANAEQNLKNAKELFESYLQGVFENGNWEEKKILDLCDGKENIVGGPFGSNLKVEHYKSNGVPILRLQNIGKGFFIDKDIKYVSKEKAKELEYHSFQSGDLALAKLGIPIGKTCIIPDDFEFGIVVADVVRIRPNKKKVDYNFLNYFLNTNLSVSQLTGNITGATRPRVNLDDVRNIVIKLPSIKEQETIVQKLDAFSTETKKLEAIYQQKINDLEELKKSVLQKAFSGELKTEKAVAV
jgi:type I restriction enzyme S subunit